MTLILGLAVFFTGLGVTIEKTKTYCECEAVSFQGPVCSKIKTDKTIKKCEVKK